MRLLIGTAGICVAVLYLYLVSLLSKKETKSWWMGDFMITNVHCILITAFLMIGVLMLIMALPMLAQGLVGMMEVLSSLLIALATITGVKGLRISERMRKHSQRAAHVTAGDH
jgi:sterol desaturase/sphingolipid hydroxylase (fatty acid hydroxylase superfamily)